VAISAFQWSSEPASVGWTFGLAFAYICKRPPVAAIQQRRKTMASKKTRKLQKGKKLEATKPLEIVITKPTDMSSPK
jgi:hypothetical protein